MFRKLQSADKIVNTRCVFVAEDFVELIDEAIGQTGVIKISRAYLDGRCPGDNKLHDIINALDSTNSNNGDVDPLSDLPDDS